MHHLLARQCIDIAAPPEAVFSYAADLENFPGWFPGALHIAAEDTLDVDEVGKAYRETVKLPSGRQQRIGIRVVEAARPSLFATEGDFRLLLPRMEMEFERLGPDRTRAHWRMYSRRKGLSIRLWLPLMRLVIGARSRRGLARLKLRLENAEAAPTPPDRRAPG